MNGVEGCTVTGPATHASAWWVWDAGVSGAVAPIRPNNTLRCLMGVSVGVNSHHDVDALSRLSATPK